MRTTFFTAIFFAILLPAAAFDFYPVGNSVLRWNANSSLLKPSAFNPATQAIRYYIASDAYSQSNATNEINAIRAAFDQWQSIPNAKVRFEFAGLLPPEAAIAKYDNTNIVFWAKKNVPADLLGKRAQTYPTYATDGSILDADIVLNGSQFQWFTNPNDTVNQAQFIEAIVSHEIGHLLGLDHSVIGGATVIDGGNGLDNTDLGLSADEVAAARYLYPDGASSWGAIRGTVRRSGVGILGAAVIVEDSAGNIAGSNITQPGGAYAIYSLPPATYKLRVTPLDPAGNSATPSLLRGAEIAPDYANAVTSFLPTPNLTFTVQAGETKAQDINVTPGDPPFRITSLSKPTQLNLITVQRYAYRVIQGQGNFSIGVSSATLQPGSTLFVTGDGITLGPTTFSADNPAPGLNSLVVPISISSDATPGLRSLVVSKDGNLAYANGYFEIASTMQDYNFDGLDDSFQRKYWNLWTSPEAAPAADPDHDGFSNRFEYRTGSDPTDPLSNKLVLMPPVRGRFSPQLTWLTDPGKTYQLYVSPNVTAPVWQPFGAPISTAGEIWAVAIDYNSPGQFFRLQLQR